MTRRELARDSEPGSADLVVLDAGDGQVIVVLERVPGGQQPAEVARSCEMDARPTRARARSAAQHLAVPSWRLHVVLCEARSVRSALHLGRERA